MLRHNLFPTLQNLPVVLCKGTGRLQFQAAGVTFQLPREGRRACLSVVCSLLLFSLLSFFRAGFSGVVLEQEVCSATSAIRGVSRGGCAASLCSGKVLPDSRGQWYQEHRAPTQEPRILQVSPLVFGTLLGIAVLIYLWGVLGFRFLTLPAVTSASEVLTQAFVKFEVESYMFAYRIVLQNRTWSFLFPESGVIWR